MNISANRTAEEATVVNKQNAAARVKTRKIKHIPLIKEIMAESDCQISGIPFPAQAGEALDSGVLSVPDSIYKRTSKGVQLITQFPCFCVLFCFVFLISGWFRFPLEYFGFIFKTLPSHRVAALQWQTHYSPA